MYTYIPMQVWFLKLKCIFGIINLTCTDNWRVTPIYTHPHPNVYSLKLPGFKWIHCRRLCSVKLGTGARGNLLAPLPPGSIPVMPVVLISNTTSFSQHFPLVDRFFDWTEDGISSLYACLDFLVWFIREYLGRPFSFDVLSSKAYFLLYSTCKIWTNWQWTSALSVLKKQRK